ncbi:MAG: MTH1187 family thiamine-binding protein [bacterium]|nr:MTH1187 family thiamine-binding protein [bacterium]
MSALAELTIFPTDKGESVSKYVAKAVEIIKSSGLDYEMGSMGTCIEGDWDRVMEVITLCMNALKQESSRVYMVLKMDYREGKSGRIKSKIESVNRHLG